MFCRECGTNTHAEHQFCVKCGARQVPVEYVASAANSSIIQNASLPNRDSEALSQSWNDRFALIEKVGGLDYIRDLPYWERRKVAFNIWGFIFGVFYYLVLGLWKKGILIALLCVVGSTILIFALIAIGLPARTINPLSWILPAAVFGSRANIDYYKKIMLGENGWW